MRNARREAPRTVTIAEGDGVGPEIMEVVLDVLRAAEVPLQYERVDVGCDVTEEATGIGDEACASLSKTGVMLRGPVSPPAEKTRTQVDAALRGKYETYAKKRVYSLLPGVPTPIGIRPLNVTMIREIAEEGLFEERLTDDTAAYRRVITRSGSLRLHRYALTVAARKGAHRVTCAHRMSDKRITDGIFVEAFREAAAEFPDLITDEVPVDELARRLMVEPEVFDVVVLPDMEGDLIADLATGLVGGLAYAPSARIGDEVSVFEPVHGPSHEVAGRDLANPTALLLAATMMLRHLNLIEHANRIEAALGRALVRMHEDEEVRRWITGFRTSVFRCLIVAELAAVRNGRAGSVSVESDSEPLAEQLEGLS